jgi:hypothetical protein
MKTMTFLLMLCASSWGGEVMTTNVVGELTSVVTDYKTKDGWSCGQSEAIYRGKSKLLEEIRGWSRLGNPVLSQRIYFAGGGLVMREWEIGTNGVPGMTCVYHQGGTNLEMFQRQPDGSVKPVSGELFERSRKKAEEELAKLKEDAKTRVGGGPSSGSRKNVPFTNSVTPFGF